MSNKIKTYDAFARLVLGYPDGSLHDAYKKYTPNNSKGVTPPDLDHDDPQVQLWYSKLQLEIIKAKLASEIREAERAKLLAGLKKLRDVYRLKAIANFFSIGLAMLYGLMQGAAIAGFVLLFINFKWAVTSSASFFMIPIAIVFMLRTTRVNYHMVRREIAELILNIPRFFDRVRDKNSPANKKISKTAVFKTTVAVALGGFFIYYGSHELMNALIDNALHIDNPVMHDFLTFGVPIILSFFLVVIPEYCMNYNSIKKGDSISSMFKVSENAEKFCNSFDLNKEQKDKLVSQYKWDFWLIFSGMMATGLVSMGELNTIAGMIGLDAFAGEGIILSTLFVVFGTLFCLPFYIDRVQTGVEARAERMKNGEDDVSFWQSFKNIFTKTQSGEKTPWFRSAMRWNAAGQAIPAMIPMLAMIYLFSDHPSRFFEGLDLVNNFSPLYSDPAYGIGITVILLITVVLGYGAYRAAMIGSEEGKNPNYGINDFKCEVEKEIKNTPTPEQTAGNSVGPSPYHTITGRPYRPSVALEENKYKNAFYNHGSRDDLDSDMRLVM